MKKIILLLLIVFIFNETKAQYVTIPDANFVAYLQANFPSCMSGNQMDTTCVGITGATSINCANLSIADLTGVQYFDNLHALHCNNNQLATLPALPFLTDLDCNSNQLTSLPAMPGSLIYLHCNYNLLTNLPTLPNTLQYLICDHNQIDTLTALPNSITYLNCAHNMLTCFTNMPNSLNHFDCNWNSLTSLPSLPNTIHDLFVDFNQLTSLPTLPNQLQYLLCFYNQLTSLPALPNTLIELQCDGNLLTSIPGLPNSLQSLNCSYNNISCFPTFPNNLMSIYIDINPFTCLPNYLPAMNATYLAYPLCVSGDTLDNPNGCPTSLTLGIPQLYNLTSQISIYPNPTNGKFTIEIKNAEIKNLKLEITNLLGEIILQSTITNRQSTIDLTNQPAGIYFVRIIGGTQSMNQKMVKSN